MTEPSKSAHLDTFTHDNLPPEDEWPTLEFIWGAAAPCQ